MFQWWHDPIYRSDMLDDYARDFVQVLISKISIIHWQAEVINQLKCVDEKLRDSKTNEKGKNVDSEKRRSRNFILARQKKLNEVRSECHQEWTVEAQEMKIKNHQTCSSSSLVLFNVYFRPSVWSLQLSSENVPSISQCKQVNVER